MSLALRIKSCIVFLGLLGLSFSIIPPRPQPPGAIAPFANGIFPSTIPGEGSSWTLEDPFPDLEIAAPLRIINMPGSDDILVLGKLGEVWQVSIENQTKKKVLDISDRAQGVGESGVTGMVLHPKFGLNSFPDKQEIYLFYPSKLNPQQFEEQIFLRLSKFKWDPNIGAFDPNSEEILIQQYDRMSWHNGGGLFFDNEGFLYLSMGDEGKEEHQEASTQRIDGGFFSGVIRIDVDKDSTRSHPIRRQPQANAAPASPRYDNWKTFSQGYYIPNDNPWLSQDSSHLEEFWAIGLRSPYSMSYDHENDQIWIADVGSDKKEEINKVDKADNLQWPYMEGNIKLEAHERPENLIGNEKGTFFEYDRSLGSCVIGGAVYRGNKFPNLNGKYLFADYNQDKLLALKNTSGERTEEYEVLITDLNIPGTELPEGPGISGIHVLSNGDIYITVIGKDHTAPSKFFKLKQKTSVLDPPSKLSELNIFEDLTNLKPIAGFIPYKVNAPLWSDRAIKTRYMAVPNDGTFDSSAEQIAFHSVEDWVFPEGTVFIKHFDLPITIDPAGPTRRLETRFFVIGEDQVAYGLTYKWNDEGTEAFLLGGGSSKPFKIMDGQEVAYTQEWDFPGRDQCMSCHTSNANFVLGVKTHQLNGDLEYDGIQMNQLAYLNEHKILNGYYANNLPQSYGLDNPEVDLELRIKSFLDANCASCHRPGGIPNVEMDLRYRKPLILQNIVNHQVNSEASTQNGLIIKPGNHAASEIWKRVSTEHELKMPPLGRNIVHNEFSDQLAQWIDGLAEDSGELQSTLIYPNPSFGHITIQLKSELEGPFKYDIYNSNGTLQLTQEFTSHTKFIDLSTLSSGIYFLKIDANEEIETERIVLTK